MVRRQDTRGDAFHMVVAGRVFQPFKGKAKSARARAQEALAKAVSQAVQDAHPLPWTSKLGELGGLDILLQAETDERSHGPTLTVTLAGEGTYRIAPIGDPGAVPNLVQGLEQTLRGLDKKLAEQRAVATRLQGELERYRQRAGEPFASEDAYHHLVMLRDRLKLLLRAQEAPSTEVAAGSGEAQPTIEQTIAAYRSLPFWTQSPAATASSESAALAPATAEAMPEALSESPSSEPPEQTWDRDEATVGQPENLQRVVEAAPSPAPRSQPPRHRRPRQLRLFDEPEAPAAPSTRVQTASARPAVQLSLFDLEPTAPQVDAHDRRPAALEQRRGGRLDDHPSRPQLGAFTAMVDKRRSATGMDLSGS